MRIKGYLSLGGMALIVLAGLARVPVHADDDAATSRPTDPFVESTARVVPSVVAIGVYDPALSPSIIYFGTGFVVHDGKTAATNDHVVRAVIEKEWIDKLRVFFPDDPKSKDKTNSGRPARLSLRDATHDVALVTFEGPAAPALKMRVSPPRQGETVGVVGYPIGTALGLVPACHRGVVAAVVPSVLPLPKGVKLTPELAEAISNPYDLYQLDLTLFPGNSGSPLYDGGSGQVVGIINKTLASRTREHLLDRPSGVGYAVPVRWVDRLVKQLAVGLPGPPAPSSGGGAGP